MKVKFSNTEVEIWKLRKGVVLGYGSSFVHLMSILSTTEGFRIGTEFYDEQKHYVLSTMLEWLEPHN